MNGHNIKNDTQELVTEIKDKQEMGENNIEIPQTGEAYLVNQPTERERELEDKYIRLLAEFENYKKRINREKTEQIKYALEEFTNELLPFLDNLDRAICSAKTSKDIDKLIEGLEISLSGYLKTLERFGIKCYVPDGQYFDPCYHEALTTVCSNELDDNVIKETMLKGFTLHDKVIRPALVVVSKKDTNT